jgi:hypothetical protein
LGTRLIYFFFFLTMRFCEAVSFSLSDPIHPAREWSALARETPSVLAAVFAFGKSVPIMLCSYESFFAAPEDVNSCHSMRPANPVIRLDDEIKNKNGL